MVSDQDREYMSMALSEATSAYNENCLPVGAVLVSSNTLIGSANNSNASNENWNSHAETSLIEKYATEIQSLKKEGGILELFSTWEPCLMCLGTSILNRIDRIVYACPDPNGGATKLDVKSLPEWYGRKWPTIENGLLREESYKLLDSYMEDNSERWGRILGLMRIMKESWNQQ